MSDIKKIAKLRTDEQTTPIEEGLSEKEGYIREGRDERVRRVREGRDKQAGDIESERDQVVRNFETARETAKRPREQLGLDTQIWKRKTDINQTRLALERQGQNTNTAGASPADLDTFRAENPELRTDTFLPELMRNKADISYGIMPKHGGLIPRLKGPGNLLLHALIPALTGVGSHNIPATAAAVAASLALLNKDPIAARLLYPSALMAKAGAELPKSLLYQAARGGKDR